MKDINALVSIIVPSYNCEAYLEECLKSLFSQQYPCFEVIVVDDGSTDRTESIVKSFENIKYVYQENQGHAAALNRGIVEARGEYLAFIDSDDLWTEDKLKVQMKYAVMYPKVDMIFSNARQFFSSDIDINIKKNIQYDEIVPGYFAGSMLISKATMVEIGPFSNDQTIGHFMDWYMKAQEKGMRSVLLKEVLYLRRVHNNNMGITHKNERYRYATILKEGLDRRRRRK